ncbi:FAD-dependent oxidoreductase [Colwellia sp. M166]|uniref:FAD-binding oxidoreductase n=1 Tax=Colwellia sp. M166 TaxID=2583805 RepID=UPI00211EFE1A|nr:FAD-binding oxidoreductase [Colwellia sp. M166]UUO23262.1 FAD-dependent oxidoreductase [Colwellia sp. M166]|tara:strand:- start:7277 stop:8452 length:1176 start_codon:yes stop_codon:yes gene_type:complete
MPTIAIIGAGLMGRLLALSLNRQGYQVTLFDKDQKNGQQSAAYAAAGLLTPLGEAMHSPANIVAMGFAALPLWPKLLTTLSGYSFFQQSGSLVVSHEQDKADRQRLGRFLANHYPNHEQHQLNREQLAALEPELAYKFSQALYLPSEGQIGNRKLLIALHQQLTDEGVEWRSKTTVIRMKSDHFTHGCQLHFHDSQQSKNVQQQSFDLAIDCRGIGAKKSTKNELDNNAELSDLRAVRGELFQLFAPQVNISRPVRLMHPRYQLYIAPKGKGHYVIGATEIESDDISPMTVRSAMELLSAAFSVHPGFAEANIRQHISQVRPAFSDNQPKIIANNALMQVNGLYRHGFLIAPIVLSQVLEHVDNLMRQQHRHIDDYRYTSLLSIYQTEPCY